MGHSDEAIHAYEQALRHNQWSITAMNAISHILRAKEKFPEAMEYLRSILKLNPNDGEVWGSLGTSKLLPSIDVTKSPRTLLPHDGQFAGGIHSLPASVVLSSRSKGVYFVTCIDQIS